MRTGGRSCRAGGGCATINGNEKRAGECPENRINIEKG